MPDLGDIPTKKNKVVNIAATTQPVSYTHLDVYKRQVFEKIG